MMSVGEGAINVACEDEDRCNAVEKKEKGRGRGGEEEGEGEGEGEEIVV
jgi:hypothetical protein